MKFVGGKCWPRCSSNSSLKKIVSVAPQTGLFLWWPLEVDLTVGKGICKGFLTQIQKHQRHDPEEEELGGGDEARSVSS